MSLLTKKRGAAKDQLPLQLKSWMYGNADFEALLSQVLPIEAACIDRPWSRADFLDCLGLSNTAGVVAIYRKQIVGYAVLYLTPTTVEIVNLVVNKDIRKKGVGKKLVDYARNAAATSGASSLAAHVHEENLAVQLFLREQGFRCEHVVKDFYQIDYPDGTKTLRDAYLMAVGHSRQPTMELEPK